MSWVCLALHCQLENAPNTLPSRPAYRSPGEASKSRQKGLKSPQLFKVLFIYYFYLCRVQSPIFTRINYDKAISFLEVQSILYKISQGQIGKVLSCPHALKCPLPNIQLCIACVLHLATSFRSGNTDVFSFPTISCLLMKIRENCERVGEVG